MTTDADREARERLAREARETATTLLDWVGTRVEGPRAERTEGAERAEGAERPRQSPGPCTWCPVCALVAALRGEQPELTATLAEQASGLLVLLRLLVQTHATGAHDHHRAHAPEAPVAPEAPPAAPPAWPAEWGAPTWADDVPWDVAPHATFDPAPTAHDASAKDPTPAPDRPTGRRGPRPSPRHTAGTTTAEPTVPEPTVPEPTAPAVGNGPTPVLRTPTAGTRRGVQRIPVRRRPRPC